MIVDASALVAVLAAEPEAADFATIIEASPIVATHSVSVYEATLAIARARRRTPGEARADVLEFLNEAEIEIFSLGQAETAVALDAFERFGKGRHPAALNMGDCFAYACARLRGMQLLYKGDDFARTDIPPA